MPAPAILSHVKCSPSVSQATMPAIGGGRYINGAERAIPRTWFTHAHTSQPPTEERTIAQKRPNHTIGESRPRSAATRLGIVRGTIGGAPKDSGYTRTISGP